MKKSKVLVTGATGFLGTHLTRDLVKKGHQVSILARPTSNLTAFQDLGVRICKGDITDSLSVLQATEGQDVVYHLAGLIAYKRADRAKMEEVNVKGTRLVIDACLSNHVQKLLHLSSVVTIGANPKPQPIDENFEFNLSEYNLGYFETKRVAENMIVQAHKENGLNAYMINPATIYGAGDATKGSRKTQVKVAKGQFKFYPPGGVNVVHIDDVIEAIHLCLDKGEPARRYIIGGDNLTLKQLFELIAQVAGVKPPRIPIPRFLLWGLGQVGDQLRALGKETSLSSETAVTASLYHWFDTSRAKKELGFNPQPAAKAIEESVTWMSANGFLD